MRLRILELPSRVEGEVVIPSFAYVLDDTGPLSHEMAAELRARLMRTYLADDVLIFHDRIELDGDR